MLNSMEISKYFKLLAKCCRVLALILLFNSLLSLNVQAQISLEHPWSDGPQRSSLTGYDWDYTFGYHFRANAPGLISELGGYFDGTATLYLWERSTGALLAEAEVTSNNSWSYTEIQPVTVQAGSEYTVAAYLGGSLASYAYGFPKFPQTVGSVTITASTYAYGFSAPTIEISNIMYGQVDIGFSQSGGVLNNQPEFVTEPVLETNLGSLYVYDAHAVDPDQNDSLEYFLAEGPGGMSIDSFTGLVSWVPEGAGTFPVEIGVQDQHGAQAVQSYTLTVNSPLMQTPWRDAADGVQRTNIGWNYTMGYDFTANRDGIIEELGGFFNGAKKVSLWKKSTKELLAQVVVDGRNDWSYSLIEPAAIEAGEVYTVAVYLAGSGGSYRYQIAPLPRQSGDITILQSVYAPGDYFPVYSTPYYMFGQADLLFIPQRAQ